jgi:putative multidrug ABC transporter ATP-binding protein
MIKLMHTRRQKMKKRKHSKLIIDEFKRTFPLYIMGMIFEIIASYISLLISQITGKILDMILQTNIAKEQIMQEIYILLFWSAIIILPNLIKRLFYYAVGRTSDMKLRREIYKKLQYVKEDYYETTEKGKFLAYLTKEIPMIKKFLGEFFQNITHLVMVPVLVIVISGKDLDIRLSIMLVAILSVTLIIILKLYKKKNILVEESRKQYINMSNVIEQNTSNFTLIKLYNNQEEQGKVFNKNNKIMQEKDFQVGKIDNTINNTTNIAESLSYILTVIYSVICIKNGQMTVGDLTVFIAFIDKMFGGISNRINKITSSIVYFKQSVNRMDQIMSLDIYNTKNKQIIDEIDTIKVNNLSYKYPNNNKYVLKDINFEINKNDKIGIIGLFGSGKTTLMNIISGLYEIEENKVFINGVDITKINKYSVFNNISYILQKVILLDDTIKNNITLENTYDGKQIINATNNSCILEDIFKMENEFEEIVGENGHKLSGGQKQRVVIARNIITDKDFIILDNIFSALDNNTEKEILNNIMQMKEKTIINIANKVTDVKDMDKIYLMVDGKFVDNGTHDELLSRNSIYQEMYQYEMAGELVD